MHHHVLTTAAVLSVAAGALAKPETLRGVAPDRMPLYYSDTGSFKCLSAPDVTIPLSALNDDYCDCPDGSDEPGTAACAHISPPTLSIPGFYCANEGHTPSHLPLARVNDGVCDYELCCDGSDEWARPGGVVCPNRCKEVGAKVRELLAARAKTRDAGAAKRTEYLQKAAIARKEAEANLARLQQETVGLKEQVKKLEAEVKIVEAREKAKMARHTNLREKNSAIVETAKSRIIQLELELRNLRAEEAEVRGKLVEAEGILKGLKDSYNPNFNDEGVKTAVRRWEDYEAAGKSIGEGVRPEVYERDLDKLLSEENAIDWDDLMGAGEPEDGDATMFGLESYLPSTARDWVHDKVCALRQVLVDNGVLAASESPATHVESKAVTDAKSALATAESSLSSHQQQVKKLKADLAVNYGPHDIFRALKDTCISADVGEYKYEYCFFGKAHQKSLKDGGSSFLGEHKSLTIPTGAVVSSTGEVHPTDDLEETHSEGDAGWEIVHDGGARCWNGPPRSARIALFCAAENVVRDVKEVEKCVYRYEVGTPVVCGDAAEGAGTGKVEDVLRDEL